MKPFIASTYQGKPAVYDTVAKVFYTCSSKKRAKEWADELNSGV